MKSMLSKEDIKKKMPSIAACFLLSGFVVGWYLFLNPNLCILYREQNQMFLFSREYFMQYANLPGGFTAYATSFLTQFFRFRLWGAVIYVVIFIGFYMIFKNVLEKFSLFKNSFFIAFIPGLLFLPASVNMQFELADELAVMVALLGFVALTKLSQSKFYYLSIPLTVTVLYVLTGGNVLLSLALFVLYLLYTRRQNYMRHAGAAILSLLLPVLIWYFFYPVTFGNAWQSLTPFLYPDAGPADFRIIAWLSVLIIPVVGILLKIVTHRMTRSLTVSNILNIVLAVIVLITIVRNDDSDLEKIVKMGFDAENNRWEAILDTHRRISIGPLNCFYTNMALQKTGQMPEKMFHFDQIGTSGLFLNLEDSFSCYAKSELFRQLGLINEAQHFAYESMIGYSYIKEPDIRNMKRLLDCAVILKNDALITKYEGMTNKTLFYRNYVDAQAGQPEYSTPIVMKDMLIRDISDVLAAIMEENNGNRAVFEYLMAWYMLERDYEKAKSCFDRYFPNFAYPHIPTHYAEFLTLYKRLHNIGDSFYEQYPISRDIRERFDMMDILISTEIDGQIQKALEDGYKNTYWFYVRFPLVGVSANPKHETKTIY